VWNIREGIGFEVLMTLMTAALNEYEIIGCNSVRARGFRAFRAPEEHVAFIFRVE
jgi:hypothetical protein